MNGLEATRAGFGVKSDVTIGKTQIPEFPASRLDREWRTMAAMVQLFCAQNHGGRPSLCAHCQELLDYATVRLQRCQFGVEKPTCANCPVHCYAPKRREDMRAVMRYSGPRMLWHHPLLTIRHWLDGRRTAPPPA